MRRNRNQTRSRKRSNPVTQELRQLVDAMRENTTLTQTRGAPTTKDIVPFPVPNANKVHTFQRTCTKPNITATNGDTFGAITFALSDLPGFADFALFEQYRIMQVVVRFCPLTTNFGASTTSASYPTVYTVIDPDDASTPVSIDILRQYDTLQVVPNQVYFERRLTPKAALGAYGGSVFTSFSQAPVGMWMDDASSGIQYYGLKWATSLVTVVSGTYQLFSVDATYTVQCRRPK